MNAQLIIDSVKAVEKEFPDLLEVSCKANASWLALQSELYRELFIIRYKEALYANEEHQG